MRLSRAANRKRGCDLGDLFSAFHCGKAAAKFLPKFITDSTVSTPQLFLFLFFGCAHVAPNRPLAAALASARMRRAAAAAAFLVFCGRYRFCWFIRSESWRDLGTSACLFDVHASCPRFKCPLPVTSAQGHQPGPRFPVQKRRQEVASQDEVCCRA